MRKEDVGIITFHCCDNYGAMLQAYGLKRYLNGRGINATIIRYEPFFMVGRHWLIPYAPMGGIRRSLEYTYGNMIKHLRMGMDFFRSRANMKSFRETYLIDKKCRKLRYEWQLKELSYQYYLIGSDQIWNPEITLGLRRVYFGAFLNRYKRRVIAYAASLGDVAISPEYDRVFAELADHVDVISVREKAAVSYIEKCCTRKASVVVDPVFLLDRESWQDLEQLPDRSQYILVYRTEDNQEMDAYIGNLSQRTNLQVIEVGAAYQKADRGFLRDMTSGPAEFLGYIHKASYVVTNSFHAVAFSIIYEKKFAVFLHSSRGERIWNILHICGLTERICQGGRSPEIDAKIEWEEVKRNLQKEVKFAEKFLIENVPGIR